MANESKKIQKKNWVSNFQLIGKPVLNDYSFKINEQSRKSDWIYNSLNLGVDCGAEHGTVYCEMMGGYSPSREGVIYCNSKDDSSNQIQVAWNDRFDEELLEDIADFSFIKVGLEKTTDGKTYVESFLSEYDAIKYIKEHLTSDMVVNVRGQLKYSLYNDNVQVRKNIQSIFLSRVEDTADFRATFTQSILVDKDSASLKDIDKATGILYVNARVLDYMRDMNGVEVKGQFPFNKTFEYQLDLTKPDICKKIVSKLFAPKKGITQITLEGDLVEGGATVNATMDDVPDDIKELIDLGIYTEEEALAKCSTNGSRERKMVLRKPITRHEGEGDDQTTVLQVFPEMYEEDDLDMSWVYEAAENSEDDEPPFEEDKKDEKKSNDDSGSELDWLDEL